MLASVHGRNYRAHEMESIDAFVKSDLELRRKVVINDDDLVDDEFNQVERTSWRS